MKSSSTILMLILSFKRKYFYPTTYGTMINTVRIAELKIFKQLFHHAKQNEFVTYLKKMIIFPEW